MAEYVFMVAAVTNHTAHYIEWEMPFARGLQFQALYLENRGITTEPIASTFDISNQWRHIAGK